MLTECTTKPAWTVVILLPRVARLRWYHRLDKAEPRGLIEPATGTRHATQFASQAHLAQSDDALRHRLVARCRRRPPTRLPGRLQDRSPLPHPRWRVDISITQPHAAASFQHSQHHGEPARFDPVHDATRVGQGAPSDQRLYFGE